MTPQRWIRSRLALPASIALVVGIALSATALVMPALAGGSADAGSWGIARLGIGPLDSDPPKPGKDLPPIGTVLSAEAVAARGDRPPDGSLLALPEVQAARALDASLTDDQRKQIAEVLRRHAPDMAGATARLPRPEVEQPSAKMTAEQVRANKVPEVDPAAMAAANASVRRVTSSINDDIRQILTPQQRELFDKSVPDLSKLDDLPLPSTAALSQPGSDASTSSRGSGKDDTDKDARLTRTERQQRERTNTAGLDEYHTEGNILGVRCAVEQPVPEAIKGPVPFNPDETPYAVIATRDGIQQVRLLSDTGTQCGSLKTGDYLEVDGVKQHEQLFDAEEIVSEPSILR